MPGAAATFVQSNYTAQSGAQYPTNIDADIQVLANVAQQFAPHAAGTYITSFGTGTGGVGTYGVNIAQTVGSSGSPVAMATASGDSFMGYIFGAVLTVTSIIYGAVAINDLLSGTGVAIAGMTIAVDAGSIMVNGAPVVNGMQLSSVITKPVTNPRIDRAVINAATGVLSIITGTENVSPTPPAIPAGYFPCAQILLQTTTTAIGNSMITDERTPFANPNFVMALETFSFSGDQMKISQDASPLRHGTWSTTASGTLYTLLSDFAMEYWTHNVALDANGNFIGRDDAGPCTLYAFTESGLIKIFNAPTGAAGSVPSFGLVYTLDTATGNITTPPASYDTIVKPGTIIDFAGAAAPAGYLICPTAQTNISRTTYATLFAAIGTTWGAGDGSTTFGMPWFPADYAAVQAGANVGSQTVGVVLAHTHSIPNVTAAGGAYGAYSNTAGPQTVTTTTQTPAGGVANLAAGVRMLKCVKY